MMLLRSISSASPAYKAFGGVECYIGVTFRRLAGPCITEALPIIHSPTNFALAPDGASETSTTKAESEKPAPT